jgi:hypothetical protein
MSSRKANEEKAKFVFNGVFEDLNLQWIGPEYDFDRGSYKARIQSGGMKGQLVYISEERLEDSNVSAENIKQELLRQLK